MATQRTYRSRLTFTTKRFLGFLKVFARSKRAIFGIGILVVFSFMAVAAPLLTPNNPTYDLYVSSNYAQPAWFQYIPGASQNVALDVRPIKDPGFTSVSSIFGDTRDWNFTTSATYPSLSNVTLHYSSDVGRTAPGSAEIVFHRTNSRAAAGFAYATLINEFYYPYEAPPNRFSANITASVIGAEDVPIQTRMFITNATGYKFYLWAPIAIRNTTYPDWILPESRIDSYEADLASRIQQLAPTHSHERPSTILFPTSQKYQFGIEVIFEDSNPATVDRDITVYVDDVSLRLYGNAYGVLGTDQLGRDLWSQLVYGSRISLFVGIVSAVLSVVIGLFVGLIAGYLTGVVDEALMRFTDALLVLPGLPLLLVLIAVLGASLWNLILVIGILGWMGFARMVRSQTLSLRERPFVEAAKAVGAGKWHIISRHILPNVMNLIYVSLALSVPSAILSEAALSWLGLFDPNQSSWGRVLYDAENFNGGQYWWWVVPPGVSIALVSLSFILLGYALDEILNPKLRQRH